MISIAEGLGGVECCRGTAKDKDKTIRHTSYNWKLSRSGYVPYVSRLLQDMLLWLHMLVATVTSFASGFQTRICTPESCKNIVIYFRY
jgi:hypothetical protein